MSLPTTGPETLGGTSDETEVVDPNSSQAKEISGKSPMQIALGRLLRDKVAVVCAVVAFFFVLVAIFAGVISKIFGVYARDALRVRRSSTCSTAASPRRARRCTASTRTTRSASRRAPVTTTWPTGSTAAAPRCSSPASPPSFAAIVGIVVGLIAGFSGGVVDRVISFITDLFLTFPFLLGALTLAPIISERFSTSPDYFTIQRWTLIGVLAIFGWMGLARLIRGQVLSLREREFVQAARVIGMPTRRILFKELLPNLVAPIVVVGLADAAGLRRRRGRPVVPRHRRDRRRLAGARRSTVAVPLLRHLPALPLGAVSGSRCWSSSLNLLGDAVRDALDPKTRR